MDDAAAAELRRAEPEPEPLSLTVRGHEDEAARGHSDSGEDALANGHVEAEPASDSAQSPGTSYWSVSEGPDRPPLLSPAPGPSGREPRKRRASRPGLSRIPGRDHRRYYHEYWRSEYLMDFDPPRHGMICMVCGSSLATLKLSTIKRHIRQKHPDSLLWSAADKDVIRSGWESHLSLGGGGSYGVAPAEASPKEDDPLPLSDSCASAEPVTPNPPPDDPSNSPGSKAGEEEAGPSARMLERYLNASLHAWFRQEFLMEYEAEAGRLLCMVCGGRPPTLHLEHIKNHVLEHHPDSLLYTSHQKHCVLQAWAQTHEEPENSAQSETDAGWDVRLIGEDGGTEAPRPGPARRGRPPKSGANAWRLRLDYLVALGPRGGGYYCMVCSRVVRGSRVRSFRRHVRECHPETASFSREQREAVAAAWTGDFGADGALAPNEMSTIDADVLNTTNPNEDISLDVQSSVKEEDEDEVGVKDATPRHSHYPGKDQRRNYQVRWRTDFLMDYDCRRHGLICMVCGAALATLKVSTIKRHIQQVHAHSLRYGPEDRRRAALAYERNAKQFVHADDCFLLQDHARTDAAGF
ncbi:zinc finger translocation-associated protein [Corythoichthys intestinalis]|uniref:zinc finger translocation-associated protein n=1 Tax=Corythoichthys intestinalis TaxID=161448 RepID=UPI0025A5E8FB|nr:zinc finger translocation-associated protein [Corythoichthys intestinalis]XP_061810801.1 zinc finger translocation-associated protein-like [Nerophis lumbriciformis]